MLANQHSGFPVDAGVCIEAHDRAGLERLLNSVRVVPSAVWRHLGPQLGVTAPELASLKALYGRGRTLFDHQKWPVKSWGFNG